MRDSYVALLSPFDRAARLQVDRPVSESEFLQHAANAARGWTAEEEQAIRVALEPAISDLNALGLPAPATITLIKTSGAEEGEAAYTRGTAIILPVQMLTGSPEALRWLMAHELFHVLSRENPVLRDALYAVIGFHKAEEVQLPLVLIDRRVTNPDAIHNDHFIRVTVHGQSVCAVPVLISTQPHYDVKKGGIFLQYVDLEFFVTDKPYHGGMPFQLLRPQDIGGFIEQVGKNSDDLIHPDEILADNFTLLLNPARHPRSPEIISAMRAAITQYVATGTVSALTNDSRSDSCTL